MPTYDAPSAALNNIQSTDAPAAITLNNNQATCMVERPLLSGREFTNVCTGQKTLLPYTGVEIVGGIIFLIFFLAFGAFFLSTFLRVRKGFANHNRNFRR